MTTHPNLAPWLSVLSGVFLHRQITKMFFFTLLEKNQSNIEINPAKFCVEIGNTIFVLTGFPHAYVTTSICTNLYGGREVYCNLVLNSYYEFHVSKLAYLGPT